MKKRKKEKEWQERKSWVRCLHRTYVYLFLRLAPNIYLQVRPTCPEHMSVLAPSISFHTYHKHTLPPAYMTEPSYHKSNFNTQDSSIGEERRTYARRQAKEQVERYARERRTCRRTWKDMLGGWTPSLVLAKKEGEFFLGKRQRRKGTPPTSPMTETDSKPNSNIGGMERISNIWYS